MPYYEIIYETGTKSLADYADDKEMFSAVKAHHARAMAGEVGGPSGHAAERVVQVEKYENNPGALNEEQTLSADVMSTELAAIVKKNTHDGVVSIPAVVSDLRNLSNPMVDDPGVHESGFKAESEKTFTEGWE